MLSHGDVHFLVGLLQVVTAPEPVAVELGSMILDDAAEEERDVDVTVTYLGDAGAASGLVGIEVKDHGRPLDVTHVEQLSLKLADMRLVTQRGIVSSSGYTEPAIRKARAHNVHLYALEDWDTKDHLFPTNLEALKVFSERTLRWEHANIAFNPAQAADPAVDALLARNCALCAVDGGVLPRLPDVSSLVDFLCRDTLNQLRKDPQVDTLPTGRRLAMDVNVTVTDRPCVQLSSERRVLEHARISGSLYWDERHYDMCFKRLVSVTEGSRAIAGCGMAELPCGDLVGITTNNIARRGQVSLIQILAADRQKSVIRRRRLA